MTDTFLDAKLFRPSGYENVTIADTATATQPTEEQLRAWTLGAVGAVTATRKMQLPLTRGYQATVANLLSGGHPLQVGGATGNQVTLVPNEVCTVVTDGVHYGRTVGGASRVQTLNLPFSTAGDVVMTADQANADVLIVVGGTDGGGFNVLFPPGHTRPGDDALTVHDSTGIGFTVSNGGDWWVVPGWGAVTVRWWPIDPPTGLVYTPVIGNGDTSHVMLGNGTQGNVPAAALPAPAANTKGGLALPSYPTGLQYQDWGGWGGPGVLVIALPDADGIVSLAQYSNGVMIFTGAMTADRTWTLPLISGRTWHVINLCTGAHSLLFKGTTGAAATVANGARARIATDGVNYYA